MQTTATLKAPAAVARCAGLIATACGHLRREIRIRQAIRHLNSLPEYLFRDIGLTHSEITSIVRNGVADRSRRHRI